MKKLIISVLSLLIVACGNQNNVSYSTQTGQCSNGTTNAPYCMALSIRNNVSDDGSGQNLINSANQPIKNIQFTTSGSANINYPIVNGSNLDPNGCLGAVITAGKSCTFYLWLNAESLPVGSKQAFNINANYTIDDTLFGGGSNTANTTMTVYQLTNLLITSANGVVQTYSVNGLSKPFAAESETVVNASANDKYYGFLYLAGNGGIYLSGNGAYAYNITNQSTAVKGASNLAISGNILYVTPNTSNLGNVYTESVPSLGASWQTYTNLPISVASNISAMNGASLFVAMSNGAGINSNVYLCNSSTNVNCLPEGSAIPGVPGAQIGSITSLGYTSLGSPYTGVVVGSNSGLWVESGTLASASNSWVQAVDSATTLPLSYPITKIVRDNKNILYIVDQQNNFYTLAMNSGNQATLLSGWTGLQGKSIVTMAFDNAGQQMFVATSTGAIYKCVVGGACDTQPVVTASFSNIFALNIISSLASS